MNDIVHSAGSQLFCQYLSVEMVSSITQDPYSIVVSLNLDSFTNLKIGHPLRLTELVTVAAVAAAVGVVVDVAMAMAMAMAMVAAAAAGAAEATWAHQHVIRH